MRISTRLTSGVAVAVVLTVAAAATPPTSVARAQTTDGPPTAEQRAQQPDAGAIRDILPPGTHGQYDTAEFSTFQANGERPPNSLDQLELYDELNTFAPEELTPAVLERLFKDSALGVDPDDVVSTTRPRDGVTILRDQFGVPHVYGQTNEDTAFGAGYAGTIDRMFLQDLLRHLGAARLTEFLGPSEGNIASDMAQLRIAAYTAEEAAAQIEALPQRYPGEGEELQRRVDAFIAGINTAQDELCPTPNAPECPVEYQALQVVPDDFTRADVVFIASLVGGIFGSGGGAELRNAEFLNDLVAELGEQDGREVFDDLIEHNDPEAPTTIETSFPYNLVGDVDPDAVALPDPGAPTAPGTGNPVTELPSEPPPSPISPTSRGPIDAPWGQIDLGLKRSGTSNALVVTAEESETGHPIAVFGPQVGYFAPQILTEIDLHGPDIAARGSSFPGTQFVVELGHGVDYAWSATSANTDNVDIVAERLCEPDGSEPTVESLHYLDAAGECVAIDRYLHQQVARPTAGGTGAPQVVQLEVLRTRHGIVQTRTLSDGEPVAYTRQRSTYGGEFDSAVGFMRINDPAQVKDAESFMQAFSAVDYTFNWFYVDADNAAYFNSGLLPQRPDGLDPNLPRYGDAEYDPVGTVPFEGHPRAIDPAKGFLTSWNNKPAPDFTAADDQQAFGPIYRSLTLDDRVRPLIAGDQKASLSELTGAMIDGATTDPRGEQLLPEVLAVVGDDPDHPRVLELLSTWQQDGALRVDRDRDGAYAHESAIALFDAWWEDLAQTVLRGTLGDFVEEVPFSLDDHPRVTPGGWNAVPFYGYVDKDLRQVLGRDVDGPYSRTYCGGGDLETCRQDLRDSLDRAVTAVAEAQGTEEPDDWTYDKSIDAITSQAVGLVGVPTFDFQNRPTYQQVVAFERRRGEAAGTPDTADPVDDTDPAAADGQESLAATGGSPAALLAALGALLLASRLRRPRRSGG